MSLRFTKMQGLGNDFMVIDGIHQTVNLTSGDIASLGRRDTGIGFDQCLIIEPARTPDTDFFYRIFNANGQEVGQCGNGARCLARFAQYYNLTSQSSISVETRTTRMQLQINPDQTVTVDMGKPVFQPEHIPLQAPVQAPRYTIPLQDGSTQEVYALSTGNPHAVIQVSCLSDAPVHTLGQQISEHALFPEQTNVEFMQIISPTQINLRVYERGCGETQACGSGAVAAVAAGRLYLHLSDNVVVSLPGGKLTVAWPDLEGSIFLTGPAAFVYEGKTIPAR